MKHWTFYKKTKWRINNFKFKLKRINYILFKDKQYDFHFLLVTELLKLQHMLLWYKEYVTWIDSDKIVNSLEECIDMLKYMIENEDYDLVKYKDVKNNYYRLRNNYTDYWWD